MVPKSQWPFLVIETSVLSAENEVNPRYDSGRTHPYHPKLRPHYFIASKLSAILVLILPLTNLLRRHRGVRFGQRDRARSIVNPLLRIVVQSRKCPHQFAVP